MDVVRQNSEENYWVLLCREWHQRRLIGRAAFVVVLLMLLSIGIMGSVFPERGKYVGALLVVLIAYGNLSPFWAAFIGSRWSSTAMRNGAATTPSQKRTQVALSTAMLLGPGVWTLAIVWIGNRFFWHEQLQGGPPIIPIIWEPACAFALALLAFSIGSLLSAILKRVSIATVVASIFCWTLYVGYWSLESRLFLYPRIERFWLAKEIALASCLILGLVSMGLPRYATARVSRPSFRYFVTAAVFVTVGAVVAMSLTYVHAYLEFRSARLVFPVISPTGNCIAGTAIDERGEYYGDVRLIAVNNTDRVRTLGRLTFMPVFSYDGNYLAYISASNSVGLASKFSSLEITAIHGGESHSLHEAVSERFRPWWSDVPSVTSMAFDPLSDKLALITENRMLIASVSQTATPRIKDVTDSISTYLIGWSTNNEALLWKMGKGSLDAYDLKNDQMHTIYKNEDSWEPWGRSRHEPYGVLPIMIDPYGKKDLVLLRLSNATETKFPGPICAMDLSENNRKLVYAVFSKIGAVEKSQLHLLDLSTGQDRVFATLNDKIWRLFLSPDASQIAAVILGNPKVGYRIDLYGGILEFGQGWFPIGWANDSIVVTQEHENTSISSLALANAGTGQMRVVFP